MKIVAMDVIIGKAIESEGPLAAAMECFLEAERIAIRARKSLRRAA